MAQNESFAAPRIASPFGLLVSALALGACSSSSPAAPPGSGDAGDPGPEAAAEAGSSGGDAGEEAAAPAPSTYEVARTFAGNYAGLIRFRKVESVGALGSENALVTVYASVVIADDAANQALTFATTFCHVELSGQGTGLLAGSGVVTPDVVMTTTHFDTVPFSASQGGGAVVWSVPEVHGPIGWKWSSPMDTMPTASSDARVLDQDSDENPGVTIQVTLSGSSTPVYVVQTERDTFSGTVDAKGDLSGTVSDRTEQNVLGSPNALLASATLTSQPDSNTADNAARFVRVPSHLACADLVAQAGTVFK